MIEVFKTNVHDRQFANMLVSHIERSFAGYAANFDLNDSDKILRVKCCDELIRAEPLIELLNSFGIEATVLPDEPDHREPG